MQLRTPTRPLPHPRNLLPGLNLIAVFREQMIVVAVGTEKIIIVFHDQQMPIARQAIARVYDTAS